MEAVLSFEYGASTTDGRIVRGVLTARDKADLIQQLQQKGLFLVSFSPVQAAATLPDAPLELAVDAGSSPAPQHADTAFKFKVVGLGCLLVACVIWGVIRVYRAQHPVVKMVPQVELNTKLAALRKDMTRAQIERILNVRYTGSQAPGKIRYAVPPDFVIEAEYDATGGPNNPENHLASPMRLLRQAMLEPRKR